MAIYPAAQWKGPIPNVGGAMGAVRLGVVHIMEGTLAGTDGWFHDPAAQVSAHFGIGKTGVVYQWVDTSEVAWAEANYNDEAISVEHEGNSGTTLTAAQQASLAALMAWVHQAHGVPLVHTNATGTGWVGHGELGVAGGNHPTCPGAPILAQLPAILAAAQPEPAPQEVAMVAYDPITGGSWGVKSDGSVYAFDGAPYLGGLNSHPEWNIAKVGTVAGIVAWKGDGTVNGGNGYAIYVETAQGFDLYRFPGNGSLRS